MNLLTHFLCQISFLFLHFASAWIYSALYSHLNLLKAFIQSITLKKSSSNSWWLKSQSATLLLISAYARHAFSRVKVSFSSHTKVHERYFTFTATTIVKQASALTRIFLVTPVSIFVLLYCILHSQKGPLKSEWLVQ